jgi:hypothetical protein
VTIEEAAAIVRQKFNDADGCGSCGWKSALYEHEPLERLIDEHDIAEGRVKFPCFSDDASENGGHRGFWVYFTHNTPASE